MEYFILQSNWLAMSLKNVILKTKIWATLASQFYSSGSSSSEIANYLMKN